MAGVVGVGFIERAGVEAVLPEVAGAAVMAVDVAGVEPVGTSDGAGEGLGGGRDCDEVDVVGHEAVGEDLEAVAVGFGSGRPWEEVEAGDVVIGGEEDGLAVISALGDMMGEVGQDDAGDVWPGA